MKKQLELFNELLSRVNPNFFYTCEFWEHRIKLQGTYSKTKDEELSKLDGFTKSVDAENNWMVFEKGEYLKSNLFEIILTDYEIQRS